LRIERQELLEMAGTQVPPCIFTTKTTTQGVDAHCAAERGRAKKQVVAAREFSVRGSTSANAGPKVCTSFVEGANDRLTDLKRELEGLSTAQCVQSVGELVNLGVIARVLLKVIQTGRAQAPIR
jgi:hypothetical protein